MTGAASLYHQFKRYRTLQTDRIRTLPIVILMPHSACNCRCVMCDIWKGNSSLKQLTEKDISSLLVALKKLETQQVLMSGGEALLHPQFFRFCGLLKENGIKISLHSTGLTLQRHAAKLIEYTDDIIVSLDGDELLHDTIRNLPGAFSKMKEGVMHIKGIQPAFRISARSVIHKMNFRHWFKIISAAKEMKLDQISFLPADVSSQAFNREIIWNEDRQYELIPSAEELSLLESIIAEIIESGDAGNFISEHPAKLRMIPKYYSAFYGKNPFPYKKCNAPWVSTVVEADGTIRPCFFHSPIGNINDTPLEEVLNSPEALRFRKDLDMESNSTCVKCVCYLNLSPRTNLNR